MRQAEPLSRELKILSNKLNRAAEASLPQKLKQEVTQMQGRIIGFLYSNRDRDLFQRDVESEFSITRATASKILTAMERCGLITRRSVPEDARLKKLELTEKARTHFREIRRNMVQFENRVTRNLTEDEKEILLSLLRRLEENLDTPDFERRKSN